MKGLDSSYLVKGQYRSNASCFFFSESIFIIVMKFAYIMGAYFSKLRVFFHKVSSLSHTVFQLVINCKMASLLLQVPPLCTDWCAVWHCHSGGGFDSFFWLAEPFKFIVLTCLMSALIVLN